MSPFFFRFMCFRFLCLFLLIVELATCLHSTRTVVPSYNSSTNIDAYWQAKARQKLEKYLKQAGVDNRTPAKNVILIIGDGMGLTTVTATRLLKQQLLNTIDSKSKSTELTFDDFEHVSLAATDTLNNQVGDSGACATALMCGVKANFETVGVGAAGQRDDCLSTLSAARVTSIADWAQQQGKSTGFVTTTRVTHATPAAFYAHSANRYWESDEKLTPRAATLCKDIARQLIEDEPGRNLNVILGGGRRHFLPSRNQSSNSTWEVGRRDDGRNLIEAWQKNKASRGLAASYVASRDELSRLDSRKIDYLLGLFNTNHLAHEADRETVNSPEPALWEMSAKALEVLKHNPNGFLLLIESGRIDHAHHQNNAYKALTDTLALDRTVDTLLKSVNLSNTLIIVTADHSQVMTLGAHSLPPNTGGLSILATDEKVSDMDRLPYTALLYANGPGHRNDSTGRENITELNTASKEYQQQSAVPRRWSTHGGEDVPVYATGSGSSALTGSFHQTFIPWAISYAACIGPMRDMCLPNELINVEIDKRRIKMNDWFDYFRSSTSNSSAPTFYSLLFLLISVTIHNLILVSL